MRDIIVKPLEKAIDPTFRIEVTHEYAHTYEVPFFITGQAMTEDSRLLGDLRLSSIEKGNAHNEDFLSVQSDYSNQAQRKYDFDCIVTERGLNHIAACRDTNRKKDVVIKLQFMLYSVKPSIGYVDAGHVTVGNVQFPSPDGSGRTLMRQAEVLASGPEEMIRAFNDKVRLVRFDSARNSIAGILATQHGPFDHVIRSSDWVQDFAPAFGIGRFISVELPEPQADPRDGGEWQERLNRAIASIRDMTTDVRAGEWGDCVEHSRPLLDFIKDEASVQTILTSDGLSKEAAEDVLKSIRGLFDFTSKFIKAKDREGKLNPSMTPQKEDALYIYSSAVTLVNLLSRKAVRNGTLK